MISLTAASAMALVALGMVLTPGPNMMYLVSRSISQGRRAGLVSLAGTALGFVVYMTMATIGLGAVFLVVPWLYTALKVIGAAYLLWLAYTTLRPGGSSVLDTRDLPRDSSAKLFRTGLLTNLLNPKAALMYLALIPQFVDRSAGHVVAQGFQLGAVQITVSLVVNTAIILTAGSVAAFLRGKPAWMRAQRWVSGTLLGAVGVKLALDAPSPATAG